MFKRKRSVVILEAKAAMHHAARCRTPEFEELKPFPCNGLIIYAVRIVVIVSNCIHIHRLVLLKLFGLLVSASFLSCFSSSCSMYNFL